MRDPSDITPLQADILDVLWHARGASAADVRSAIAPTGDLARTTVATMLGRMEKYGWLKRTRVGREYLYSAALTRAMVRRSQVRRMISALFPEDLPSLVSHALREGDWSENDLDSIQAMVREHRRKNHKRAKRK